jgi:O-antigen ligase
MQSKIEKPRSLIAKVALVLWFLSLNFQTLTLSGWSWGEQLDARHGQAVKIFHLVGMAVFVVFVGKRWRIPKPPLLIAALFASFVLLSLTTYIWSGFNPLLLNYVFALLSFLIGQQFGNVFTPSAILKCIRIAIGIVVGAILLKSWIFRDALIQFLLFPFNGHPEMPLYFYGGGPNLEATWVALSSTVFLGTSAFVPIFVFALMLSIIYASRTAVVISIICLAMALLRAKRYKTLIIGFSTAVISVLSLLAAFPEIYVVSRFLSIGSDPGSVGRLSIWAGIWDAFLQSPIVGHGAGNGMRAVEIALNTTFPEANVHNYYAQVLLDFGLPALCLYAVLVLTICVQEARSGFRDQIGSYLILFFIAGLFQFRGAEALSWFLIGLYATRFPIAPRCLSFPTRPSASEVLSA